jgi:adenosylhomocysteinase
MVHDVPADIEQRVCKLKLKSMGIKVDTLTQEQIKYLATSGEGT